MYLAIVIVALIVIATISLKERFQKPGPPIEDLDEHMKYLMSLPDQNARQKYLKNRKPGDK